LKEMGVDKAPVDVLAIATRLGIQHRAGELGDDVSGLLMVKDGEAVIGYNRSHSRSRQRFTIAHEIGHYSLHYRADELFIDKGSLIMYRDGNATKGEDPHEREANAFAAELLMPELLVRSEIAARALRLSDERDIEVLAHAFDVSVQAMTFRLLNLGIIQSGLHA
jgi:Zn-dependent peptidase ImmA (M78 family)